MREYHLSRRTVRFVNPRLFEFASRMNAKYPPEQRRAFYSSGDLIARNS